MIKDSFFISLLSGLNLLITVFFQIFILNIFGVGDDLDAYYASSTVNAIIVAISLGAINSAITPILIKLYKNGDDIELSNLTSSLFNIIFLIFLFLGLIQYVFAEPIVKVILPGFKGDQLKEIVNLFQIQAFLSIITILISVVSALNYTYNKFNRTIIYPIIGQFAQILFVWFFHKDFGIYSLVYGLILYQFISFTFLAIPFVKLYKFRITFNPEFKNASRKIFPLIISSGFSKSNILFDRFFASTLAPGSITILQYGEKIVSIVSGFINSGISLVSLRKFSLEYDNQGEFQRIFYLVFKTMIFIAIPVAFIMVFFFNDVLNIIVFSKKLSYEDIRKIYLVIVAFIGVLIGGSLSSTITNAFYAKGLTSLIAKVAVVIQILGLILKVALFYIMGFWGLPIAFSIISLLGTVVLFILYYKHIYKYNILKIVKYVLIMTLIALFSVGIPYLLGHLIFEIWYQRLIFEFISFTLLFIAFVRYFENDISKILFERIRVKLTGR